MLLLTKETIVLDRDGVINEDSKDFVKNAQEWKPLEKSLDAIALLNQSGRFRVVVASNQSGIARGLLSLEDLKLIHEKMQKELADRDGEIDDIVFCPHHPKDECSCRKPKDGLITQLRANCPESCLRYFIGDSLRDLQCALQSDILPILVLTGNGRQTYVENQAFLKREKILVFVDLMQASQWILS